MASEWNCGSPGSPLNLCRSIYSPSSAHVRSGQDRRIDWMGFIHSDRAETWGLGYGICIVAARPAVSVRPPLVAPLISYPILSEPNRSCPPWQT